MANTYTQIYIQYVFAVQNKTSTIQPSWEDELYKYMTGFIQNRNHKLIAINGVKDHLHVFVGMHPTDSPSNLMKELKGYSSKWINENQLVPGRFQWQEGFSAFSYGRSQIDAVYQYVMKQKEHHRVKTFLEEYVEMLQKFDIEYDERYVFKPIE